MARRATRKAEFTRALKQLLKESELSLKQLAEKAGSELPRTTAHNLVTKQFPKREGQLRAFLTGCGVSTEDITRWVKEWQRLLFNEQQADSPDASA
ncbi:hypothetical protein [Lentzea atacamensis]|nr:hypothetical protein [Lentzea atacamensis]